MKKTLFKTIALLCFAVFASVALGGDLTILAQPISAFSLHGDILGSAALIGFGGMTTLAADAPRDYFQGDFHEYPVIAADIIFQGAAVGDNASGYARPLVAGDPFRGFAQLKADNTAGAAGNIFVRCRTRGDIRLAISALAITDVGKDVYASDDNTFTLTAGSNTRIGFVHSWEQTGFGMIRFESTSGVMTELTDNTGGTANTTLTALGGIVTLTDSTGLSATHDDTLAATAAPTTLTDSTSFSGTHDDTLAAVTVMADIAGGEAPTEGEFNTLLATVRVIAQNQSDIAQKVIELITLAGAMAQNDSDIAQKTIELVADMDDAKNNFADLAATTNSLIRRLGN